VTGIEILNISTGQELIMFNQLLTFKISNHSNEGKLKFIFVLTFYPEEKIPVYCCIKFIQIGYNERIHYD
jgi:hypothetical protein